MDKLALAKQRMKISFICCIAVVGWGAGWRMATHGDIFWMLMDGFPIVLIVMASQRCKQLIQELENQSAPSADPATDSPDAAPEITAEPETTDPTPPDDPQ